MAKSPAFVEALAGAGFPGLHCDSAEPVSQFGASPVPGPG
jgi:hypothetical protein